MAGTKISGLTELTTGNVAATDLLELVDVSDTTMAASGTNKKATVAVVARAMSRAGTAHARYGNTGRGFPSSAAMVVNSVTTHTHAADRLYFVPFVLDAPITISDVHCEVTTGAGTNARLGVYNAAVASNVIYPTSLVADWGTVATAATGVKSITSLSTTIGPGVYAFAYICDNAPAFRMQQLMFFDMAMVANSGTTNFFNAVQTAYAGTTYGALPGTFTAGPGSVQITSSASPFWLCPIWVTWS